MKKQLDMILQWHKAFDVPYALSPVYQQDWDLAQARETMMREELKEWAWEAKRVTDDVTIDLRAKELGDILFTVFGTIVTEGLQDQMERVFEEIYKSNMSKLDANGKALKRPDGKVLKGPNYRLPDLGFLLTGEPVKHNDRLSYSTENIDFKLPDPSMSNLLIQISKDYTSGFLMTTMYVKFSFKTDGIMGDTDQWFIIDNINPIRVFDGGAVYNHMPHYIRNEDMFGITKEDLITLVSSWTLEDFQRFRSQAIHIGLNDQNKLYQPPEYEEIV